MEIKHNFEKALYTTNELIKIISVSRAHFYRLQTKWIALGYNDEDYGKLYYGNLVRWNGPIFLKFLNKEIKREAKYDYEFEDKKIAVSIVKNLDIHYEKQK